MPLKIKLKNGKKLVISKKKAPKIKVPKGLTKPSYVATTENIMLNKI